MIYSINLIPLKMKSILLISAFIALPFLVRAQQQDTVMLVNGICHQCQGIIEKAALQPGVSRASWSPETKELQLTYDPLKISLETVSSAIVKTGYDTEFEMAAEEDYQALHACCHYRDEEVIKAHKKH